MPFNGLLLFLPTIASRNSAIRIFSCQCPSSGFFYFYERNPELITVPEGALCQCPSSGFFYFYKEYCDLSLNFLSVSMPFIGLLLFLQGGFIMNTNATTPVSMPFIGLLLFLRDCYGTSRQTYIVSMPFIGLLLFLPSLSGTLINTGLAGSFLQVII